MEYQYYTIDVFTDKPFGGNQKAVITDANGLTDNQMPQIAQAVEMGRPSLLKARTEKKDGEVTGTWIGGSCVMISNGIIYID